MIELRVTAAGVSLPVRAQPGSRRNEIVGIQLGALKVAVTQVAEKGKANRALLEIVAKQLGLRKSQLQLTSGETSRDKVILVKEISVDDLRHRIDSRLAES